MARPFGVYPPGVQKQFTTGLDRAILCVYRLGMSRRESDPRVAAAFTMLVIMFVIGAFVFVIGWGLVHWNSSTPAPSCESIGAHVVWLDDDHTVCVRNGRVVTK